MSWIEAEMAGNTAYQAAAERLPAEWRMI